MTRVVVCKVGEPPTVEDVPDPFEYCRDTLLGGNAFLEYKTFYIPNGKLIALWDEDGRSKELPFNRPVGTHRILGNFLFTKADDAGIEIDLSDRDVEELLAVLTPQMCERCKTKPIAYQGAVFCGAACSARSEAGV